MDKIYDLIILGGGPASMSAGIYAEQLKLNSLIIEKDVFGGQIATTSSVSNYLGFPKISGNELCKKMFDHLLTTGIEIYKEEIVKTELTGEIKKVHTHNNTFFTRSVIIGIGTKTRNLGVENENKFLNKGISYSSLKDRDLYENKQVAVVGGGNSALEDAIYLSEKASKVYLIHRRNEFRADGKLVQQVEEISNTTGKIQLVMDSKLNKLIGEERITGLVVENIPTGQLQTLDVEGIFIAIGRGADTDIIDENIQRNSQGYIITDENMQTNLPGVYAVGDIRTTPFRQIITATADGAIASMKAFNYTKSLNKGE